MHTVDVSKTLARGFSSRRGFSFRVHDAFGLPRCQLFSCVHSPLCLLFYRQERASSDYRLNYRLHEACGKEAKRLCPSECGNLQREFKALQVACSWLFM